MTLDIAAMGRCLDAIRARRPLIHNITNLVVTNSTANALLALGASPAMVEGADEVAEFAAMSAALVINLGTMSADRAAAMRLAVAAAQRLARATGAVVAVTGAVDYVTDGTRTLSLHNGDAMMARVTGLGCTATAIVAACLAVEADRFAAAGCGLAITAVAGELAAARSRGPGSLQLELYDALYQLVRRRSPPASALPGSRRSDHDGGCLARGAVRQFFAVASA